MSTVGLTPDEELELQAAFDGPPASMLPPGYVPPVVAPEPRRALAMLAARKRPPAPLPEQMAPHFLGAMPAAPVAPGAALLEQQQAGAPPAPPLTFKPAPPPMPLPDGITRGAPGAALEQPPAGVPSPSSPVEAARAVTAAKVGQAQAAVPGAEDEAQIAAQHEADTARIVADSKARIDAAAQRHEQALQTYQNAGLQDFWENKSAGHRIAAAIAVGFGQWAAGPGGHNAALQIINQQIEQDKSLQLAKIEKMGAVESMMRTGLRDAQEAKQQLLQDLDLNYAAKYATAQARAKARLVQAGVPVAQAEGDAGVAKLGQEAERYKIEAAGKAMAAEEQRRLHEAQIAKMQADAARQQRRTVVGGAGGGGKRGRALADYEARLRIAAKVKGETSGTGDVGKYTEAQAKTAFLARQIGDELTTIGSLPPLSPKALATVQDNASRSDLADSAGLAGVAARKLGLAPRSKYEGLTPNDQRVANAWDNAIEKIARQLTGAGMPVEEARRLTLQMSPHAGDTPAILAEKLARMKSAASQLMATSGNASKVLGGAAAPPPDEFDQAWGQ